MDAARATLAAWRAQAPVALEPELLLARLELTADRYRAAHVRALAAIRERACPPELAMEVVNCLRLFVAHDGLISWAAAYPHWREVASADRARVAGALSAIGAISPARAFADAALADAPNDAVCRVNRAMILTYVGEFDVACADLERAIDSPQNPAMAHWLLARLRPQSAQSNHVQRLRERNAAGDDALDKEYLYFALFKELDDLGDFAGAWQALDQGCRCVRTRLTYDRAQQERLFAALRARFPLEQPAAMFGGDAQIPIFIVGMHRSGTTLVENMLATHADVCAHGETQRLSAALRYAADHYCQALLDDVLVDRAATIDYRQVAEMFLAADRTSVGDTRYHTEKMPGNFQMIGFIRHALPQAKVIHLRRNAMDLCFANLRELFADGVSYSYALEDLAHFHSLYEDLMRHWHALYPGFVFDIDYEELVAEPAATSRRIFEFCGLEWSAAVIDPAQWAARSINTLSAVQSRQGVSTSSVGRWKPYANWLEPLRRALEARRCDVA